MIGDLLYLFAVCFAVSFGIVGAVLTLFVVLVVALRVGGRTTKKRESSEHRPIDWH